MTHGAKTYDMYSYVVNIGAIFIYSLYIFCTVACAIAYIPFWTRTLLNCAAYSILIVISVCYLSNAVFASECLSPQILNTDDIRHFGRVKRREQHLASCNEDIQPRLVEVA